MLGDIVVELQIAAQRQGAGREFCGLGVRTANFATVSVVNDKKPDKERTRRQVSSGKYAACHVRPECTT